MNNPMGKFPVDFMVCLSGAAPPAEQLPDETRNQTAAKAAQSVLIPYITALNLNS
jgi:hypothetical protein